jgi:hypothetical protein
VLLQVAPKLSDFHAVDSQEGTEALTAKCETERPASHEQLMEEVCERENCWQRVKANKGSP